MTRENYVNKGEHKLAVASDSMSCVASFKSTFTANKIFSLSREGSIAQHHLTICMISFLGVGGGGGEPNTTPTPK